MNPNQDPRTAENCRTNRAAHSWSLPTRIEEAACDNTETRCTRPSPPTRGRAVLFSEAGMVTSHKGVLRPLSVSPQQSAARWSSDPLTRILLGSVPLSSSVFPLLIALSALVAAGRWM